jgi:hypothetical protein
MSNALTALLASKLAKKILIFIGKWEYNRAKEREAKREQDAINHANSK